MNSRKTYYIRIPITATILLPSAAVLISIAFQDICQLSFPSGALLSAIHYQSPLSALEFHQGKYICDILYKHENAPRPPLLGKESIFKARPIITFFRLFWFCRNFFVFLFCCYIFFGFHLIFHIIHRAILM